MPIATPPLYLPPPLPVEAVAFQAVNMDALSLSALLAGVVTQHTDHAIVVTYGPGQSDQFFGEFDYAAPGLLTGGLLNQVQEYSGGGLIWDINRLNFPVATFMALLEAGDTDGAFRQIFAGDDKFKGSAFGDLLRSYGGNDSIAANAGDDTVFAGAGNDTIDGGEGHNYLRGDDGNDVILGGSGFDDINGNAGNDRIFARGGDDWALGGKGDDEIHGEDGADLVYGNLGNDTLFGGAGADTIRGGQGNDLIYGDSGDDWLSGDLGTDVLVGGAGADTFHFFAGAGVDRVLDFHAGEGDRVQIDAGAAYTVDQVAASVVVRIGLDQLVLENTQLSTLPAGWIFVV